MTSGSDVLRSESFYSTLREAQDELRLKKGRPIVLRQRKERRASVNDRCTDNQIQASADRVRQSERERENEREKCKQNAKNEYYIALCILALHSHTSATQSLH